MPFVPQFSGREHMVVSDAMFDLDPFPKRLLVVGGGYIACEFASIFNGLGAQGHAGPAQRAPAQRVRRGRAPVPRQGNGRSGVDVRLNAEISMITRQKSGLCALLSRGQQVEADVVLCATGRVPNTEGMGLEAAGVKLDERGGVVVDAQYRSSVPSIFAVGDVSTRQQLTPVALAEAMAVVDTLFGQGKRKLDYEYMPTAVFTHPNIGTCGYTEAAARDEVRQGHHLLQRVQGPAPHAVGEPASAPS